MALETHILTLSCPDRTGIAARVFSKIAAEGGFVKEAAQFGDELSRLFFMRIVFTTDTAESMRPVLRESFKPLAAEY